jgi:hypothetical protein
LSKYMMSATIQQLLASSLVINSLVFLHDPCLTTLETQ